MDFSGFYYSICGLLVYGPLRLSYMSDVEWLDIGEGRGGENGGDLGTLTPITYSQVQI